MNNEEIAIIKNGLDEYCENTFGMCLPYIKEHDIDYNLTGDDELSVLLRKVNEIQKNIINMNDINVLLKYRTDLFNINKRVSEIIGG